MLQLRPLTHQTRRGGISRKVDLYRGKSVRLLTTTPYYCRYKSMENTGRFLRVSGALTLAISLALLQATQASSFSPWPYLQIYPPVNESDGRTPLYFAHMLSFGGDNYRSVGALPGTQLALDYINSQPSILPGYSLHYTLTDSQVWQDRHIHYYNPCTYTKIVISA